MSTKKRTKIRIAANGYRLCDPLPKGEVLKDCTNKEWILGSAIGSGGFGDIYSCRRKGEREDRYVIKLDNIDGPLFAEINFYLRVAKRETIDAFVTKNRLKCLGMPEFIANGIHDKSSIQSNLKNKQMTTDSQKKDRNAPTVQYRFLVMERFGEELIKCINERRLSVSGAADCAAKMIDVLQYIHTFGYIHADIKATNILKSLSKSKTSNEWYLVDYGLVERYLDPSGRHREEKPDKKRANNGTVEYRSRDAHIGLISRRSDIECLAYNLIQWLYGTLPWMSFLVNAAKVEESKVKSMKNVDQFLATCFPKSVPNGLKDFLREVNKIGFNCEPNYKLLKDILLTKVAKSKTTVQKNDDEESDVEDEDELPDSPPKRSRSKPKIMTKPMPRNRRVANKRSNDKDVIDLSDSEDSCHQSVAKSPPKRTKSGNTNKTSNNENNNRLNSKSPDKRSKRRQLPRYSTALLIVTDSEDLSSDETAVRRSSPRLKSINTSVSDIEESRGTSETPAMKAMREMIERKRLEKESKKRKKKV